MRADCRAAEGARGLLKNVTIARTAAIFSSRIKIKDEAPSVGLVRAPLRTSFKTSAGVDGRESAPSATTATVVLNTRGGGTEDCGDEAFVNSHVKRRQTREDVRRHQHPPRCTKPRGAASSTV
jgi:hypothetical protein